MKTKRVPFEFQNGFTLLEVVLALSIAFGLLTAALFLNRQLEHLRQAIEQEVTEVRIIRSVLDLLSLHLRQLVPGQPVQGTETELSYVTLPPPAFENPVQGEALLWLRCRLAGPDPETLTNMPRLTFTIAPVWVPTMQFQDFESSFSEQPNLGMFGDELVPNPVPGQTSSTQTAAEPLPQRTIPSSITIAPGYLLQFRYWTGTVWTNEWHGWPPPRGIEVNVIRAEVSDESFEKGSRTLQLEPDALTNHIAFRRFIVPLSQQSSASNGPSEEEQHSMSAEQTTEDILP